MRNAAHDGTPVGAALCLAPLLLQFQCGALRFELIVQVVQDHMDPEVPGVNEQLRTHHHLSHRTVEGMQTLPPEGTLSVCAHAVAQRARDRLEIRPLEKQRHGLTHELIVPARPSQTQCGRIRGDNALPIVNDQTIRRLLDQLRVVTVHGVVRRDLVGVPDMTPSKSLSVRPSVIPASVDVYRWNVRLWSLPRIFTTMSALRSSPSTSM